jgi:hypothetical protein
MVLLGDEGLVELCLVLLEILLILMQEVARFALNVP